MGIPFKQALSVGAFVVKQHLLGRKRYPLVLMMEPLFRCNLACAGCGKIDYPDEVLNQRISVADAMSAIDECDAPVVVLAGGEPLLHKDLPQIVRGALDRGKYVTLCTNALLLEKRIGDYEPHDRFNWSIHLDGNREMHDKAVCQEGVYEGAVAAIELAKAKGFRVSINTTLFSDAQPAQVAAFLDEMTRLGIDGISISPGYAYERAPDRQHFLNRKRTKELFRDILRRGRGGRAWPFFQSPLFLDFLAGNQGYQCTPWGNPTYTVFGWQKPCYLLGEGYAKTFKELMDTTDWDSYGTGAYEKCADCMVHSGFEATAVGDAVRRPWKVLGLALKGVRVQGPMAPDIPLENQRPAEPSVAPHAGHGSAEVDAPEAGPQTARAMR